MAGSGRALSALRRVRYAGFASRVLASRAAIAAILSIAASILACGGAAPVAAQDSSRAILGLGDAVVTGFSGVRQPATPLPPATDAIERTFIDLDRPSARIINLDALTGPPVAQLVPAPKPFSVTAGQIGQVFAIALDDATPPNIYLAATSAYGLPIVVPDRDRDGRPDRSRRGAPNANFMPGLFGPVTVNGGPGSIWKIDGRTGTVVLFANVTLDGVANSGPALGGLAFDPASRQLFVADRGSGMIHRFGLDGTDRGRFDHGASALPGAGLAAVRLDPRIRLDLTNPNFDSGNPATWTYAPPARRIFALAYRSGRIYYAVAAGLQIWSVSIAPNGTFGSDPRLELNIPPGQSAGAEISNIVFDDAGRMIVAERGAPTGAYDYVALAAAGENRVLRFRLKRPEDPPSPGLWFPMPEDYAIGFPPNYRNDNGGLAIGYGHGANGAINRAACGGTLWSTGEQLRNARDPSLIQRLQVGGPLVVNGLQGNGIDLVRPLNEPPFQTYFVDYDDRFEDPGARGHLGDIEIWRVCAQTAVQPPLLPLLLPPLVCPPGWLDVGGVCVTGQACPQGTEFADGCCVYRDCPASYVRINGRCVPPPVLCRVGETYADGRCVAAMCPPGLVVQPPKNGSNGPPKNGTNGRTGNGPAVPKILKGIADGSSNTITVPDPLCPGGGTPGNGCIPAKNGLGPPVGDGGKKMCAGYCGCPDGTRPDRNGNCARVPPPGLCPIPPLTMVDGKCCAVSRDLSVEVLCRPKGRGESCDTSELPYQDTMCCSRGGSCTPSSGDSCSEGLHRVCRGEGPLKACSCERCPQGELLTCDDRDKCRCVPTPQLTDTCPAGTVQKCVLEPEQKCECVPSQTDVCPIGRTQVCTGSGPDRRCTCEPSKAGECQFPNVQQADGTCCKYGDYQAGKCGTAPECLSCKEGEKYCKPGTLNSIDCVSSPPTNECRPSGVWSCCTQASIDAGTCAASPPPPSSPPPPPIRVDCSALEQRRGLCVPPPVRADCTGLQQRRGECVPPPQTSQPPSDPPGAQLGFCPSMFTMVGASCCNPLGGGSCLPRPSGSACPSHYVPVGDGVTAQCCRQAAIKCTRRAENASCPSGEVPIKEGAVSACCREDPAGNCTPPSTPTPNPPSAEGGGFPDLCDIPLLGLLCVPPAPLSCDRNADCPSGQTCRDGVCAKAPTANSACSAPSLVVNGVCCTPEAVAAGTCGQQASPPAAGACKAGLFPSNDGKTCCTKEEITRETCGIPPAPQKAQKVKTTPKAAPKKQEIVCQKGFHLEGNRCVADSKPQAIPGLNIQFGIGIGGGRPGGGKPGGGSPPPRPPSTPN